MWNLSSDQGNLGSFFFTTVRLVWYAHLASNFNVSLPYMQIKTLRVRESKFGQALVVETYARAGGYILGFRVDPKEKLEEAYKELSNLHVIFSTTPNFGVEFSVESETAPIQQLLQPKVEEDVEITEEDIDTHAIAAYYVDGADGVDDDSNRQENIQFDTRIGLAIEALQPGITLESLWKVV